MNEKKVLSVLQELGWECRKDEAGDYYCCMEYKDLQIQVIPSIGRRSDHYRVSFVPSISTRLFSAAVARVFGRANDHAPIIVSNMGAEKIKDVSTEDIIRIAGEALVWASAQDVEAGLAAYRSLPTDAKGALPLRHLAALALAGEVERLQGYKRSFDQDDRLGFVPYISVEMVERAIAIAQEHQRL